MKLKIFLIGIISFISFQTVRPQEINNLVFPDGIILDTTGDFGHIEKMGHGPIKIILIADIGFGWEIYKDFMINNKKRYTMYALTLPGSDNTPPLPMPPPNTSYGKRNWLESLQTALINLINKEKLDKPIVAANLVIASWLAINTAINYPDKISKVIVFSGMAYATWPSPKDTSGQTPVSIQERTPGIDYYFAPKIFKTVTRETWIKNLFQPYQYANDSTLALKLFNTSASIMIPTMARYLCEFYTTDNSVSFDSIKIPVLVMMPGFNEQYLISHPKSTDKKYFWNSWDKAVSNSNFKMEKIPDARLFLWVDQSDLVNKKIQTFLEN